MQSQYVSPELNGGGSWGYKPTTNHSLAARWGSSQLFNEGFVGVPATLVTRYARLGLSTSEFVFVLQLMLFKWSDESPFPSYKVVAKRMGVTTEMARRHARSLESKGLLQRRQRIGQSNLFDLLPLTHHLQKLLKAEQTAGS